MTFPNRFSLSSFTVFAGVALASVPLNLSPVLAETQPPAPQQKSSKTPVKTVKASSKAAAPAKKTVPSAKAAPAKTAPRTAKTNTPNNPKKTAPAKKNIPHKKTNTVSAKPQSRPAIKKSSAHPAVYGAAKQHNHHKPKVIQCVGFIHMAAPNYKIRGDAHTWWKQAKEKHYARGQYPEPDAVLSFKATKKMYLGHVALVRSQQDDRTIHIDHAHWGTNGIDHNVRVVDISDNNDWTAVRVAVRGHPSALGSVYPTNGFIYPRLVTDKKEAREEKKLKPFGNQPTRSFKIKLES